MVGASWLKRHRHRSGSEQRIRYVLCVPLLSYKFPHNAQDFKIKINEMNPMASDGSNQGQWETETQSGERQRTAPRETAPQETASETGSGSLAALVGATGGAGTTRTAVELATTLARDDRSVLVVDAAFATQGLSEYVSGQISPDVTALVTDATDQPIEAATVESVRGDTDVRSNEGGRSDITGTVELLPTCAPFERLARAKTPAAAERFEELLGDATTAFDHVLVDVPPVASNQAIGAVSAAETVVTVTPADDHGRDALVRLRDRLADLAVPVDAAIGVGASPGQSAELGAVDVSLPETTPSVAEAPSCLEHQPYGTALVELAELVFDCSLSIEFAPDGVRERVAAAIDDRLRPDRPDSA